MLIIAGNYTFQLEFNNNKNIIIFPTLVHELPSIHGPFGTSLTTD